MKRKIYAMVLGAGFLACGSSFAQTKNVGIGTATPDGSAVLDIQSDSKGLLIPRMSSEQMRTIHAPAAGLMVYQTGEKSGFYFYNGKEWRPLTDATEDAKSVAFDPDNWGLNGNSVSGTNFIGTTNAQPIRFKVNNVNSGIIDISGTTRNTFFGYQAGQNSLNHNFNTAVGYLALTATPSIAGNTFNTALGSGALRNATGIGNIAIGVFSGQSIVGNYNIGLGTNSLAATTTGHNNLAIGQASMSLNQSGYLNVAIGANALQTGTAAYNTVSIGANSGQNATGYGNIFLGFDAGKNEVGSQKLYISNSNTSNPLIKGEFDNKNLKINTGATTSSTLGFLAVGNFDAGFSMPGSLTSAQNTYRLIVQDGIITEKVKVALRTTADWADYVFEPEYKSNMLSLEEVEEFTLKNKHLPNVPSAQAMKDNGLDVGDSSRMFMEKIEELTLYIIELNKELKNLKVEISNSKK
jgi:hypothetical protein